MARSPYEVPCVTRALEILAPLASNLHHAEQTHLGEREPKSGSENNCEEGQPAESESNDPWEAEERPRDERAPDCSNGLAHDRVWDEPEGNDPEVK